MIGVFVIEFIFFMVVDVWFKSQSNDLLKLALWVIFPIFCTGIPIFYFNQLRRTF